MKLHEAVFDAMSDIDDKWLKNSETKSKPVPFKKIFGILGMVCAVMFVTVLPHVLPKSQGAKQADYSETAAEINETDREFPGNITVDTVLADRLTESGRPVNVRITVRPDSYSYETAESGSGTERVKAALEAAGISVEIKDAACIVSVTGEELKSVVWPEDMHLYLEAEGE